MPTWSGSRKLSPAPGPLKTGRATRAAPGLSNWAGIEGLRLQTGLPVLRGYDCPDRHLPFPPDKRSLPLLPDQSPGHVSTLSGWVSPYPTGYDFPLPFGGRHSLLGRPVPLRHGSNLTVDRLPLADLMGVSTFRVAQAALGELASLRREPGTVSAGPLKPADHHPDKDVTTTFVPSCITTFQPRLHLRSTRSNFP